MDIDRHPPADRRCQIYIRTPLNTPNTMQRCVNPGTRWVKWGGCACGDSTEVCEAEFYSWECDGPCSPTFREAAA